jgi:glycosidase
VAVYLKKNVYSFSVGPKKLAKGLGFFCASVLLLACSEQPSSNQEIRSQANEVEVKHEQNSQALQQTPLDLHHTQGEGKPVIYQVFTRLFGNTNTTNKPWGTIDENGVGKFADFNDAALQGIKELGTSYIWYTGVPHHAVINDYSAYGISLDDPDVVKGRAGSPYAVKDYYDVNPDLAIDPANRLAEFEALITRTHKNGMKVIIDIVPNHVARQYESTLLPEGQSNFGENDDVTLEYAKHNNFYYIQGKSFEVPDGENGYQPLGGEAHPLADAMFDESPAKWTGNGSRAAKPNANDWYETVKVNYGVRPDGSYDFPQLPEGYAEQPHQAHYAFWQQQQDLPDSWYKFEAIVHYWLDKGVDGFRYDMAEMVPVEFWSFLNSSIKAKHPDALLLAEVYNPALYRDYLHIGKMDYLYDKVEFYDNLKWLMQGKGEAQSLENIQASLADIEEHMLHFLENHDEQRIASPDFAGSAQMGKPALAVSALISRSPTMLYFGQDGGEDGSEETGFGDPTRTTIFDYAGVPAHQRWMNYGAFDGADLSDEEKILRQFYIDVMNISAHHASMQGEYLSLHSLNVGQAKEGGYSQNQFAFLRASNESALVVLTNFSNQVSNFELVLPNEWAQEQGFSGRSYPLMDLITEQQNTLELVSGQWTVDVSLPPLGVYVYELRLPNAN